MLVPIILWVYFKKCKNNNVTKFNVRIETKAFNTVPAFKHTHTPVHVWTFWEGDNNMAIDACLKRITKLCLQTNGTFIHTHLDYSIVTDYIPDVVNHACYCPTNKTLTSDIIRLLLLEKYGGIWLDAGVITVTSMYDIVNTEMLYAFQGYHNPYHIKNGINYPVIENSVMYSPPGHPLIKGWLQSLKNINDCCEKSKRKHHTYMFQGNNYMNLIRSYHFAYYALYDYIYSVQGIHNIPNVVLKSTIHEQFFLNNENVSDLVKLSWNDYTVKYSVKHRPLIKLISSNYTKLGNILKKENISIHPQSILCNKLN